jgi:hypothetical protein
MGEDTHRCIVHKSIIVVRNALPYDAKGATECIELASCSSIHECWPDTIARLIRQSQMSSSGVTCEVATTLVTTNNKEQPQQVVIVVGFLAFKRISHLSYLYVRPNFQRQGVGRALCMGTRGEPNASRYDHHYGQFFLGRHFILRTTGISTRGPL